MTHLRKRMLEELQRRNYSKGTIRGYLQAVQQFAGHFGKSPDKLGPDELRSYQAYLLTERKLAVGSVVAHVAALRFFFVRTLKRQTLPDSNSIRWLSNVRSHLFAHLRPEHTAAKIQPISACARFTK